MTRLIVAALAAVAGISTAHAQQQQQPPQTPPAAPSAAPAAAAPELGLKVEIEPAAMTLVKAMCDKLAAAKTMSFTAVTTYESPDRTGEPLVYMSLAQVALQRPNKLRVITLGDGPRNEFYYDGKTVQAYEPAANLLATVKAPDTIDATLRAAYEYASIYFPFTDVILSDPLEVINENLKVAFVVGKSIVVGGVPTDIVVLVGKYTHVQLWIGSDDKLPRMARAIFIGDPSHYRHTVQFSDWKIDPTFPADTFTFTPPAGVGQVPFARPDAPPAKPADKK
ncbi:MAG: DUF2092 domain-containing protein [Alphaproteobacteria bacterium]|nr:DUF2092 domain-containing protein [Alphaproteobacteria bacterium]